MQLSRGRVGAFPTLLSTTARAAAFKPRFGHSQVNAFRFTSARYQSTSGGKSSGGSQGESYASRLWRTWRDTKVEWYHIPAGVGIAVISLIQLNKIRRRQRDQQLGSLGDGDAHPDTPAPIVKGPWQVHVMSALPLKALSRLFGGFNTLTIPTFLRNVGFTIYGTIFGCNFDEMKEPDLTTYPNLSEFFYRELKDGARPIDPSAALNSPSDGRVLHFGIVEGSQIEQIKGLTYDLKAFLGKPRSPRQSRRPSEATETAESTHSHNLVADNDFAELNGIPYTLGALFGEEGSAPVDDATGEIPAATMPHPHPVKLSPGNKLFFCVVYLAPGDYHRFHSPANWIVETRRHFAGELYSVSPYVLKLMQGLFVANERVALLGRWKHGFMSMTPVGATNVGSIKINFDQQLETNTVEQHLRPGTFTEKHYNESTDHHQYDGIPLATGQEMGGFRLGSTVVLVFEAPENFQFVVQPEQRIKMGEALGVFKQSN
ncbi:phosphatidylserine decarboxylase [Ramicandelaber brevisporus]|nr:phosphatidylserine decarboxylase [Ramicandelaber brevisporus]